MIVFYIIYSTLRLFILLRSISLSALKNPDSTSVESLLHRIFPMMINCWSIRYVVVQWLCRLSRENSRLNSNLNSASFLIFLSSFRGCERGPSHIVVLFRRTKEHSCARVIGGKIAYFAIGETVIRKYANAITACARTRLFYEVEKSYECFIVRNVAGLYTTSKSGVSTTTEDRFT